MLRKLKYVEYKSAAPPVAMKTTLSFVGKIRSALSDIEQKARDVEQKVKVYCPGYNIQVPPVFMQDGRLVTMLKVEGAGDYLPTYAGNLDIINSSCLELCEKIATTHFL